MVHRNSPVAPRKSSTYDVRCATMLIGALALFGNGCRDDVPEAKSQTDPREHATNPSESAFESERELEVQPQPQPQPQPPDPEPEDAVEIEETETLGGSEVGKEVGKLKNRKKGKALHEHLGKQGFKPGANANKDLFGRRTKYKHPDQPNMRLTHTVVLQNYEKEGSSDLGAIGSVTISSQGMGGGQSTTYDFVLIAPDGDFDNPIELMADDSGAVVEANSWYSCLWSRIRSKCAAPCISALYACGGTWAAYLACLGVSCGSCLSVQLACCSCDCSWWCKWGVGCCDR